MRRIALVALAFGAIGSVIIGLSHAETPITISQGASRNLSQDFFGFNGDGSGTAWDNPAFFPAVDQLNPETIRGFVGGTTSDYLNWGTGQYFITSSNPSLSSIKPGSPGVPLTFSTYVNALKSANANGVFNLNVMTYCPASNTAPASTAQAGANCTQAQACGPNPVDYTATCTNTDYTWGLNYQIAMLKAAQAQGVTIKYIELGNELYITNNPDYAYYFPSPQAYVNKANAWIPVLKQNFPGAKVAIIGQPQAANSTETAWNQAVIGGVHGEDAITFHTYYGSGIPNGGSIDDPQNLATLLSKPTQAIYSNLQNSDLSLLPNGVSAWITEWNLWSDNLQIEHGSWAQGLTEANYAIDLAREPRVELTDNHNLVSGQLYGALFSRSNGYTTTAEAGKIIGTPSPLPTTQPFGKTAGGFALSALLRSLHGATSTSALNFSDSPVIAGTSVPGLVGQSFTVNGKTNLYLVNLSAQDSNIDLGSLAGYYSALQYASSPSNFVTGDDSIPTSSFTATNTVTIPAYSVTSLVSATPPPGTRGDVTGPAGTPDGKIDIYDVSYEVRNYNTSNTSADISGPSGVPDGKVDIYDMSYVIRNYDNGAVPPAPTTSTSPSGQAMPTADLSGWKHIFADDFTTNAPLGSFGTVYANQWSSYGHWPDTAGQLYGKMSGYFTDKVVSVQDGILDKYLHTEYDAKGDGKTGAGNYMMSAALEPRIHGAGTSGGSGQLYGRYSVRLHSDAVNGYKVAWLLWPDSGVSPGDGEIDFAETNLTGPLGAFVHKQNGTGGSDQTAFHTSPAVYLSSGWHTVTLEWAPTLNVYVDGVLEGQTSDRVPNTPMHVVLQTESALTSTTSTASGHLQLDWISIWSKT